MKRKSLFKSLLVAAGLFVGGSAWADVVQSTVVDCNFENSETLFTATKDPGGATRITVSNSATDDNHYVNFANGNNAANGNSIATYDFSSLTSDATAVEIAFDAYLSKGSPNYHHLFTIGDASKRAHTSKNINNTGAIFTFGMKRGKFNNSGSNVNYWSINNAFTTNSENNFGIWLHVWVNIDLVGKKVSYKINNADESIVYEEANIDFLNSDALSCTQIDYNSCLNSGSGRIDNLLIKKYVDNSTVSTSYTVKYQNASGEKLKDDAIYDTFVGSTITASSDDMATFYSNDASKKYIYKEGNTSLQASSTATDNIITLVFDEYDKVNYSISAKYNETSLGVISSGEAYSDGSTTAYWSKYIKVGDQWYETNAAYGKVITESGNTDIAYNISTISYFVEAETINKSHSAAASATGTQYSGGQSSRHYGNSNWWTDSFGEGGYYKLYFPYTMANASPSTLSIQTRDSNGALTETGIEMTNTGGSGAYSGFVTIPAGSSLALVKGEYNSNILIDYLTLTKINSMSIVGDFSENGWEPDKGIAMTQDATDLAIWTAVVDNYVVTSSKMEFQYKAVANGNWNDYVLGNPNANNADKNQEYDFDYDGAGPGTYKLTFTVNTTANTVELAIEKQKLPFTVSYVDTENKGNLHAYTYNAEELGGWPGTAMTKNAEQQNGFDVYTITFEAYNAPEKIVFNVGDDSWKTGNLDFVNNSLYGIAWPMVTITDARYATYCSPYALDFSEATDLIVYRATVSTENKVSFDVVTEVPAGEGVLLKLKDGVAAGDFSVKPIATAAAIDNDFIGVLTATQVDAGSFVLLNTNGKVGFYRTKNAFTVSANTAYLPKTSSAREFIGFDGEDTTTGIDNVNLNLNANKVYNLNGQRVNKAQKGLYIVNGKKVVLK